MTSRSLGIAILAIWLLGVAVGVFAPATVLTENGVVHMYASTISHIFDPQGRVTSKSNFPEVSTLYYSIVWWSFPLWFSVIWKWVNSQVGVSKTGILFKAQLSFWNRLGLFLLLPLWFFLIYATVGLNHGGDTRLIALGSSRFQLAIFGMAVPAVAAFLAVAVLFTLKRLTTFNKTGEKNDH